jgi:hypothetical protein
VELLRARAPGFRRQRVVTVLPWLAPVGVAAVMYRFPTNRVEFLIGAIIATGTVLAAARYPERALLVVVVFLPLQLVGLPLLYHFGVSGPLLRQLGGLKEALGLGILLAAVSQSRRRTPVFDRIDRLAFVFLGGLVLYLLLPRVLVGSFAIDDWHIRSLAFRNNVAFVVLFLAVRHAGFDPRYRRALVATVIATAAFIAAVGIYQWLDPKGFLAFLQDTAEVPRFQVEVGGVHPIVAQRGLLAAALDPPRVGSILISPFDFCDYLIVGLGFVLTAFVHTRARTWLAALAGLLIVALAASNTRSDILAVVVMMAFVLRPRTRATAEGRLRLIVGIVAALVLLAPVLAGSRLLGGGNAGVSTTDHAREFTGGYGRLFTHPLGTGLGTGPGIGQRFQITESNISDNMVLQVGNEVGIPLMLVFLALYLAITRAALKAVTDSQDLLPSMVGVTAIGIFVAGQFHHVFVSLPLAWTFWGAAGIVLGSAPVLSRPAQPVASIR